MRPGGPAIADLLGAYAAGRTTPTAVAQQHLARIGRLDRALRAFAEVDEAGALRAAAESDARVATGALRELEGIPLAIKANIAVAGLRWSAGMRARRDEIARSDAASVHDLRAAGAIILGTLNMHEAAFGATTDNPWFGRTMNPHRPGHTPGGSSGGSGAAVAAGLCVGALGSDTLGSIRIPAAYNGIYGLKPTHGAVASDGLVPLAPTLDTIGPLARSLGDLETLARVLLPGFEASSTGEPALRRLVLIADLTEEPCEPAVVSAYERARAALGTLPSTSITLPHPLARVRLAGFMVAGRALAAQPQIRAALTEGTLSAELAKLLGICDQRSGVELGSDCEVLAQTGAALRAHLGSDGVLLLPAAPQAAFAHTPRPPSSQAAFTVLASCAGLPAISLPAGLDADRLPVGVQLVGPGSRDFELIGLGRTLDNHLRGYAPPLLD
ncbi:MAG TPA: amidase [Steroidobacteraceae bacterium]|nr:amidase [Steroidobacteraceae bacterium]